MGDRQQRIDVMRGLAMTCVVLGHAIQRNITGDEFLFRFVGAFEMPLFAFVTGYLTRPCASQGLEWLGFRAIRLMLPFFSWAPILWLMSRFKFTGLDIIQMPSTLHGYLAASILTPEVGLWYLIVAFYWSTVFFMVCALLGNLRRQPALLTVAALVASLLLFVVLRFAGGLVGGGEFSAWKYLTLTPFFAAGATIRACGHDLGSSIDRRYIAFGTLLLLILAVSLFLSVSDWWAAKQAFNLLRAILGVAGCVLLVRCLPKCSWIDFTLTRIGTASLGIYAIHLLFLRTGIGQGWIKAITSFVFALALSFVVTIVLTRTRFPALLLLGKRARRGHKNK